MGDWGQILSQIFATERSSWEVQSVMNSLQGQNTFGHQILVWNHIEMSLNDTAKNPSLPMLRFFLFLKCVQCFWCSWGNPRHRGGGPGEVVSGQLLRTLRVWHPKEVSAGLVHN